MIQFVPALVALLLVLQPATGQIAKFAKDLRSSDPCVWREASFHLVECGKDSLSELDRLAREADPVLSPRLIEIVEIMLLCVLEPKEIKGSADLWKLCEPGFEEGRKIAKKLAAVQGYHYEYGLGPPDAAPNPDGPLELVAKLLELGAAGVPAASELLDSQSVVTRMYGAVVLASMGAVSHTDRFRELAKCKDELYAIGGCGGETMTLGECMAKFAPLRDPSQRPGQSQQVAKLARYVRASRMSESLKTELIERIAAIPDIGRSRAWKSFWTLSRDTFCKVLSKPRPDAPKPAR